MGNNIRLRVLLCGPVILSACSPSFPLTDATASEQSAALTADVESAGRTDVRTATPDPLDTLREQVYAVLGPPFEAEPFRSEFAKTAEEEALLLASVPEGDVAAAFNDYLDLYRTIENHAEVLRMIQDRLGCDPGSYLAVDPASMAQAYEYKVWGEGVADFDADLTAEGVPSTSDRHYVMVDCDDPQSRAAGVEEADAMAAESERKIVSDEDLAEAALSEMIRWVFSDSFGVDLPSQVEFSRTSFTELRIVDLDRRPVAVEYYDIAEIGQEAASHLWSIFDEEVGYELEQRHVQGLAISPDPAVPVAVAMAGGYAGLYSIPAAVNAVAHQLIAPYPLGNGEGSDGRAISETFSIVLERELARRLVEAYFADSPNPIIRQEYADLLELGLDRNRRHLPLPPNRRDPDGVYGSGPVARVVFELRNCGMERGQSIGEFFNLMRTIDTKQRLAAQMQDCNASRAAPSPTGQPPIDAMPITYQDFEKRVNGATEWSRSAAPINCLPQLLEAMDCAAVAFGYSGLPHFVRFALRVYVAQFPDATAAGQASIALSEHYVATGAPLEFPAYTYIQGLRLAGAWMVRDKDNALVILGFPLASTLSVLVMRSGLVFGPENDVYYITDFAVAQYDRLVDYGYRAYSTIETDCAQAEDIKSNALANPSFETDPGTYPILWALDPRGTDLTAEWTADRARTGEHALLLAASRPSDQGWPGWFTTQLIRLCSGYQYQFRAWASSPDGAQAWLGIEFVDVLLGGGGGVSSGCTRLPTEGQDGWQELAVTLDPVRLDGVTVRLSLQQCMPTPNGTISRLFLDDVFFGALSP